MNPDETSPDKAVTIPSPSLLTSFEAAVRQHPYTALLLGTSLGIASVLVARAMVPPAPASR